jgi:hypothetical protein
MVFRKRRVLAQGQRILDLRHLDAPPITNPHPSQRMNAPWIGLFAAAGSSERMPMRILRKRGEPLLILPSDARLAAQAMSL